MEEESNLFSLMVSVYAVLSTIALLSSFSPRHGIIELSLSLSLSYKMGLRPLFRSCQRKTNLSAKNHHGRSCEIPQGLQSSIYWKTESSNDPQSCIKKLFLKISLDFFNIG